MKSLAKILVLCIFLLFSFSLQPIKIQAADEGQEMRLTPKEVGPVDGGGAPEGYGLEQIEGLPKGEVSELIVRIIKAILGVVGVILFAMLVYGGFMYMTSAGNETRIGLAKRIITYAIIGIVIILASYIIAEFVIRAVTGF